MSKVYEKVSQTRPVIFVLDDDNNNLEAAIAAFSEIGEVVVAHNYKEGLEVIISSNPDVAFIDLNFPMEEGGRLEKLGERFRDEIVSPKFMTSVIVTGGFHHNMEATEYYVQMNFWVQNMAPEEKQNSFIEKHAGAAGISKNSQLAWQKIFNYLPENMMQYLKTLRYYKENIEK